MWITILAIMSVAFILFIVHKKCQTSSYEDETLVCEEVCNIFCNNLVFVDLLCGIKNDVLNNWIELEAKFGFDNQLTQASLQKVRDLINYKKNECNNQFIHHVKLQYQLSKTKTRILSKHKISNQDIAAALGASESYKNDLINIFDDLIKSIDVMNNDFLTTMHLKYGETILKCFQHTANALFYTSIEGLCSFPSKSLATYNQQITKIKNLPTATSLTQRKEDYNHYYELEMKKASELLDNIISQMDSQSINVELIGEKLLNREVNIMFAGSKELQSERDLFANVISQLQTKWKERNLNVYGYSYENFKHEVIIDGQQVLYNDFIQKYANIIVFVVTENIGEITRKEFEIALESFKNNSRPQIFVYHKETNGLNEKLTEFRNIINKEKQYWQDYADNKQLRLLILNDLSDTLQNYYQNLVQERNKIVG